MSNALKKIEKNKKVYEENQFYLNMTPEMYKTSLETVKRELASQYNEKLLALGKEYDRQLEFKSNLAIETISVELLYELLNQMNYFDNDTDPEIKSQIVVKLQNIYDNIFKSIKSYAKISNPNGEFLKKKSKVTKIINIDF